MRLFASLQKWSGGKTLELDLEEPATLGAALHRLGIPECEVAIVITNGNRSPQDAPLRDGDDIQLFPAIGGG